MKKTITFLSLALLTLSAFNAKAQAPEGELVMPRPVQEYFYGQISVTWGFYEITDNMGNEPMQGTLTYPDGSTVTKNGKIQDGDLDANPGTTPTTENNVLNFTGFIQYDSDLRPIDPQNGVYKFNVPAGTVLIDIDGEMIPNPETELTFKVTGPNEIEYMSQAEMVYPASKYTSYLSSIQLNWTDQKISFTDIAETIISDNDTEIIEIDYDIDGITTGVALGYISEIEGGNEDQTGQFTMYVLTIDFPDYISYLDGTFVTVYLPEGVVENEEGEINPSQEIEVNLYPQQEATLNPTNGSSLMQDSAIVTFTWEGISLETTQGTTLTAINEMGDEFMVPVTLSEDAASMTADMTQLPLGKYEVTLPEAFVLILTEENIIQSQYAINSEMYLEFTIEETDGIKNISINNNKLEIYSINGVNVLNTTNPDSLKSLRPGIYVINGKKTVITNR